MRNTNLKIKEKYFPLFVSQIRDQLMKGAKKYAQSDEKEWTDLICDAVGTKEYIIGCIMKYSGRIVNGDPRQEEDVFKIATYAYLLWLKLYAPDLPEDDLK
jgi:hypothetical protein